MKEMLLDLPIPIMTPRLLLRAPTIGDGIKINEGVLETFDHIQAMLPWLKSKPSLDDVEIFCRHAAANWILRRNDEPYLPFFLFDTNNKEEFIGSVSFHHYNWDVPCLEIGYWVRKKYAGQGYMKEAVNALTRYAINQLGMKRIEIRCDAMNTRSRKIAEALGYQLEATLKSNRMNTDGSNGDTLVFVAHNTNTLPALDVSWPKA